MELSSAGCADCCSDCTPACCDAACCALSCQLLPPEAAISYEYHEPEENFVSIDDAKIKSLLLKIGQQQQELQQQKEQQEKEQQQKEQQQKEQQLQIIELLDDDEVESVQQSPLTIISLKKAMRSSPDIQLIPKPMEPQRIVARIELSDSEAEVEEEEEVEAEEDLPTTAVSCEPIIVLQSDDEDQLCQQSQPTAKVANKKRPTRPYMKRRGRHSYQCQACGKKVQSNYNLRRHMMIHTGERPFPCDLCDRRFREFSDLKKHRRRHYNHPLYICMICKLFPPMAQDSTRCADCEGKNLLLNPQSTEKEAEEEMEQEREHEQEEEEEEEQTDEELEAEKEAEEQMIMSPPVATAIPASPTILLVTLVPPLATPPQPAPMPIAVPAPPSRPPMPRSCSSANSSSSLSNDAVPRAKSKASRNRRSYPCPLCHRPFGTRHNLKRHYMIHTGEKPFSCSKCRKPFRECSTLKKHMVTHVRDRWYKCLRCPAKYQDYLHYTEHKATHGTEPQLELDSTSVQRLRSSESEDGDSSLEDWLECCECQRRFTQLDAYTAHLKQHDLELYGMSVDDLDDEDQEVDVA